MGGGRWRLAIFSCCGPISSGNYGSNLIDGHRKAGCLNGADDGVASLVPRMEAVGAISTARICRLLGAVAAGRRKGHDRSFLITIVFFCVGMALTRCGCRTSSSSDRI